MSPYAYGWNDPVNYADPSGMMGERKGGEKPGSKTIQDCFGGNDDDFIFDQFGRYVRTEKTNAPHHLVIEHSTSKYQRVYQFNDAKTDAAAINYNINKFGKDDFKKMQYVFFVKEEWLKYAAFDSTVGNQSWLENKFKPLRSVGEEMDPAAYNLPQFFDEQNINLADYWNDSEIFNKDIVAESVISSTINSNRAVINTWLRNKNAIDNLVLEYTGSGVIGRDIMRKNTKMTDMTNARIVLKKRGNSAYFILTAHPK